jgi:folate-binding protein YgfZ
MDLIALNLSGTGHARPRRYNTGALPCCTSLDFMNEAWSSRLLARGARVESGVVHDFGDPEGELAATASGSVLADLSHLAILAFDGDDARAFLHAQLSCDVETLPDGAAAYGAYCTPKGRVLANFLLWHEPDGFRMLLSSALLPAIQKRLRTYVLRSRVEIRDRSNDLVALGASGPAAPQALTSLVNDPPSGALRLSRRERCTVIALPGAERFLLVVPGELAPQIWDRLSQRLKPVGTPGWEWLEISNGLPWITPATQDEFVPQMANLELIGGVDFRKGCYPGQEIIARTQHLGQTTRRLFRAHIRSDVSPAPGQALYSEDLGEQAVGTIVNAAPAPGGGFDVLAVVRTASAAGADVRLGSPSGAPLRFSQLPYPLP